MVPSKVKDLGDIGASGACNVDVMCRTTSNVPRDAVAKIVFTKDAGTYLCTGTLITDSDVASQIPYFWTAHHCIHTQIVADTVVTYWFFRRAACGGPDPTTVEQRVGGAELLSTRADTDYTLMQLDADLPPAARMAGWSNSPLSAGSSIYDIHHPRGDLQKWSGGTAMGFSDQGGPVTGIGNYIRVEWDEGVTEPGSSGSGLFTPGGVIRGQLWGGESSCANPDGPDWFGRFDLAWPSVYRWITSLEPVPPGTPFVDTVAQYTSEEYRMVVPSAQTRVVVDLTGLDQNADLYVRRGNRPTLDVWDCRPALPGATPEKCTLPNSSDTTYYIRVRGLDFGTTSYTLGPDAVTTTFSDDFETNDITAWTDAVGYLSVAESAAHGGDYGLQVTLDVHTPYPEDVVVPAQKVTGVLTVAARVSITAGDGVVVADGGEATFTAGERIVLENGFTVESGGSFEAVIDRSLNEPFGWVEDDSPEDATSYNAEFFANFDDLVLGSGDEIEHFVAYSDIGEPQLVLLLRGGLELVLGVRASSGELQWSAGLGLDAGWNKVVVSWESSTDATASFTVNDGFTESVSGVDTDAGRVDSVRWGAVGGTADATTGSIAMDDFAAWP
jgi:hypothetical protein